MSTERQERTERNDLILILVEFSQPNLEFRWNDLYTCNNKKKTNNNISLILKLIIPTFNAPETFDLTSFHN